MAEVLLPHLCEEVRACTAQLRALERLARAGTDALADGALVRREEDLCGHVHRAGWVLARLGALPDQDLARGRHEPAGLRWMLAALGGALRVRLVPDAEALPRLAPEATAAVPLVAAWCGLQAARGAELRWSASSSCVVFGLGQRTSAARAELARRCARLGAEGDVELATSEGRLELRWSEEGGARGARDARRRVEQEQLDRDLPL